MLSAPPTSSIRVSCSARAYLPTPLTRSRRIVSSMSGGPHPPTHSRTAYHNGGRCAERALHSRPRRLASADRLRYTHTRSFSSVIQSFPMNRWVSWPARYVACSLALLTISIGAREREREREQSKPTARKSASQRRPTTTID